MAVTGARRNFMYFLVGVAGSCHDATVVNRAGLVDKLPPNTYMLFDAGGPLVRDKILTPYRGCHCDVQSYERPFKGIRTNGFLFLILIFCC